MNERKKKILIIAAILILVIAAASVTVYKLLTRDPNLAAKKSAQALTADEPALIEYKYDSKFIRHPEMFTFEPQASADYSFVLSEFDPDEDVVVVLHVMDDSLSDIKTIKTNTAHRDDDGNIMEASGKTALQKGDTYYVAFDIFPVDKEAEQYAGTFSLKVSESEEEISIKELREDRSVSLSVTPEGQTCAVFRPEKTGYYRLDTSIMSSDASAGFSSVSSVTSSENKKIDITEGICALEQGQEYYIWVAVNETGKKRSKVRLSCKSMETVEMSGFGEVRTDGAAVIEYTAESTDNLAVYSVSEGDPSVMIFEQPGFPLRTDDNSSSSLSENKDDFAVVISTEKGKKYYICVYGKTTNCTVRMLKYTGDGSSLTSDDIEEPDAAAEETDSEETEETEETEEQKD